MKKRNFISKIRVSKVTDYAALRKDLNPIFMPKILFKLFYLVSLMFIHNINNLVSKQASRVGTIGCIDRIKIISEIVATHSSITAMVDEEVNFFLISLQT